MSFIQKCKKQKYIKTDKYGIEKYGLYSFGGMELPCKYDKIEHVGSHATFVMKKDGKYGFCDFTEYNYNVIKNFCTECYYESIEFGKTDKGNEYFVLYDGQEYQVYVPMALHLNEATEKFVIAGDYLIYDYYDDIQVSRIETGEIVGHINKKKKYN